MPEFLRAFHVQRYLRAWPVQPECIPRDFLRKAAAAVKEFAMDSDRNVDVRGLMVKKVNVSQSRAGC